MLSSQSSELRTGHQRQNSTPVHSVVATKAPYIPVTYNNQYQSHRKGLSLDHSLCANDMPASTNTGNNTATTNQGIYEQQQMRETQTPRLSRPGHQSHSSEHNLEDLLTRYLACDGDIDKASHDVERNFRDFGPPGFDPNSPSSIGTFLESRPGPNLAEIEQLYQFGISYGLPQTPRKQTVRGMLRNMRFDRNVLIRIDTYPMTPVSRHSYQHPMQITQSSPVHENQLSSRDIPQASQMKRGSSCQESSTMKRSQSAGEGIPSPPRTAPLKCSTTFDMAPIPSLEMLDITTLNLDLTARTAGYSSSNYSPMTSRTSPALTSMHSSPELAPTSLFGVITGGNPQLPTFPVGSPKKSRASSPKKAQEVTEDMIIEETGITIEQVDAFIQGPDSETNMYTCLYDDCKFKPFPRKENIRAHVQTHLGDRKYVCAICNNRFVRPNDLKRHANTHQDSKEFVCICGAAFGRQDALRRHKQRKQYCLNGDPTLELKTREEKKRGRPRKIAPVETNERRERKENIRKQVMAKKRSGSVATSVATSHSSPDADYGSPEHMEYHSPGRGYSPGQRSLTPPASPTDTTSSRFSAFQSQHSQTPKANDMSPPPTRGSMTASSGHFDVLDSEFTSINAVEAFNTDPFELHEPSLPANNPPQSSSSQYGTPPELEVSSSSPSSRFFEFENPANPNQSSQSTDDLGALFDLGSQSSLDDMFPLFGEDPLMPSMPKTGETSNDFALSLTEDFDWGST